MLLEPPKCKIVELESWVLIWALVWMWIIRVFLGFGPSAHLWLIKPSHLWAQEFHSLKGGLTQLQMARNTGITFKDTSVTIQPSNAAFGVWSHGLTFCSCRNQRVLLHAPLVSICQCQFWKREKSCLLFAVNVSFMARWDSCWKDPVYACCQNKPFGVSPGAPK